MSLASHVVRERRGERHPKKMNTKSVFKLLFLCCIISILGFSVAHSALAISVELQNPLSGTETVTGLINKITGWVLGIAGSIMMIVLIFAGFRYLTAGANEDRAKSAKKMLTWAIIGIAVIVGAAAITNAVMDALGVPDTTTGGGGGQANVAAALDTIELAPEGDLNGDGEINAGDTINVVANLTNNTDQDITLNNVRLIAVAAGSATGMNNFEQGDKKKVAGVSTLIADEQEILECGYREYWIIREFGPITVKARETVGLNSEWTVLNIPDDILIQLETSDATQQQACELLGRVPIDGGESGTSGLLIYANHTVKRSSIEEGGEPKVAPGAEVTIEVCLKNDNAEGGEEISARAVNLSPQEEGVSVSNNPRRYAGVDPQEEKCEDYDFSIAADYEPTSINFKIQGAASDDKVSEANIKVDLGTGGGGEEGECSNSSGCVTFQKYIIQDSSIGGSRPNAKVVPGATVMMDVYLENKTSTDFGDTVQATLSSSDVEVKTGNPGEYRGMGPKIEGKRIEDDHSRYTFEIPVGYAKNSISFTIQGSKVTSTNFNVPLDTSFKPNLTAGDFGSGIGNALVVKGTILHPTFSIKNSGAMALAANQDFNVEFYACYGADAAACAGLTSNPDYKFHSGSARGNAAWWYQDGSIPAGGDVMVKYPLDFRVEKSGNLYFGIKLDTGNSVNESNENDNTGGPYEVEIASWNAEVKELTLDDDPTQGTRITYIDPPANTKIVYRGSFKITNTGTGDTNLGSTDFYYKIDLIDGSCAESTKGLYNSQEQQLEGYLLPGNSVIKNLGIDTRENYPFTWQPGKSYRVRIVLKDHSTLKRIPNKVVCAKAFTYGGEAIPTYNAKVLSASLALTETGDVNVYGKVRNDSTKDANVSYAWRIDKNSSGATDSFGCLQNASTYNSGEGMNTGMPTGAEVTISKKIAKPTENGYYQSVVTASVSGDTDATDNKKCSIPLKIENGGTIPPPTEPAIYYDMEASKAELSYDPAANRFKLSLCVKNHSTQNGQVYSGFIGYYSWSLRRGGIKSVDASMSGFTVGSGEQCFEDDSYQTELGDYRFSLITSLGNQNIDVNPGNDSIWSNTVTISESPPALPPSAPADYKTEISTYGMTANPPDNPGTYNYRIIYQNKSTQNGQPIRANVSWGVKMLRSSSWSENCPASGGSPVFSYNTVTDSQNGIFVDMYGDSFKPPSQGYYHLEAWAGVSGYEDSKSYKCTSVVHYIPATSASLDLSRANAFALPLLDEQIKNFWQKLQEVIK
ncbi:MAG: pilin [Candidatus Doudnabacteria bacterium]